MRSNNTQAKNDPESFILKKSSNRTMNFLNYEDMQIERDLLTIGTAIFNLEALLKLGKRIGKITIPLSRTSMMRCDLPKLRYELEDLLLYVLVEKIEIEFETDENTYRKRKKAIDREECDTVCLFSGGVDSYSGILNSVAEFGKITGVSVIHGDQSWGSHIVDKLTQIIERQYKITFYKLYAPPMMSKGYSQLRGFLYCLYGGVILNYLKAKRLLITEVGPTMYQPRFSPYDTVTMTTHPFVLKKVRRVMDLLIQREFDMILPFENMTKAEVVATSPLKEGLPSTHSCISLRLGRSDGTCYGCVVRRLGFLVAGVKDTIYTNDPIGNDRANADNLASLMRFSLDMLTDYRNMLASSKENVENFKKRDLFERFAIDTFAALYEYQRTVGPLNSDLLPLYKEALKGISEQKLLNRIEKVRRATFRPNFSRKVL